MNSEEITDTYASNLIVNPGCPEKRFKFDWKRRGTWASVTSGQLMNNYLIIPHDSLEKKGKTFMKYLPRFWV